ncbi:high affinity cationic amino acid transporter 1-like [Ptychodera flava]|uniref:high affinity cationic amino acid transporter 1-like n=1 Tax=Ptychodera flava TaxID=63121 RepID=UPI00396A900A
MAVVSELFTRLSAAMFRTKGELERLTAEPETASSSKTSLSMFEMTKLGVGNHIGIGVFIIVGQVASGMGGPSTLISLTIAAVASLLTGLCYAEFSARVPRKLSTVYTYTYILVGELTAFLVGWSLVLVYTAASALCARSISATLDYLMGNPVRQGIVGAVGGMQYFDTFPDFMAFSLVLIATLLTIVGVKHSVPCMDICTVFNFTIVLFTIAVGSFYATPGNWNLGDGYAPYGVRGIFTGAACCFFAFLGFDIIGTAGKNNERPSRNTPSAISIVTVVSLVSFIGIAVVITLMAPYTAIDSDVPIPSSFAYKKVQYAKIIVGVSAILTIFVCLLGAVMPLIGIFIAMAQDRIIFKFLGDTYGNRAVPVSAMIGAGILAGAAALLFRMRDLVELIAVGVLLIYSIVCACVIALRYQPEFKLGKDENDEEDVLFVKPDEKEIHGNKENEQKKRNGSLIEVNSNEKEYPKMANEITENQSEPANEQENEQHDENEHGHEKENDAANEDKSKESDVTSISSDSEDEPETDIDAIVEEYKEKIRVASLTHIEGPFSAHRKYNKPTELSGKIVSWSTVLLFLWLLAFAFVVSFFLEYLLAKNPWVIFNVCLFGVLSLLTVIVIARRPENREEMLFKVPVMPWLPTLALFVNIYLLVSLPHEAWIRFIVWMFLGLLIYFMYGICHSREAMKYTYSLPEEEEEHILLQPMPRYEITAVLMPTQNKRTRNKRMLSDVIYEEIEGENSDVNP